LAQERPLKDGVMTTQHKRRSILGKYISDMADESFKNEFEFYASLCNLASFKLMYVSCNCVFWWLFIL